MTEKLWMIYGAYGYTGELIAREAKSRGLSPILAGRNPDKLSGMAEALELSFRAFSLEEEKNVLADRLKDVELVLNCAGPFSATAKPMMEGCLHSGSHYLDITGEINVFREAHARHRTAEAAGIVICSGVGFDVIPTDAVAATLKAKVSDARSLALAFEGGGRMSPGTSKTSVESLKEGGKIRENGVIRSVPLAYKIRKIRFEEEGEFRNAVTIPWGDIATAYYSTGIGDIRVFMSASRGMIRRMKMMQRFRFLLGLGPVQRFMKARIEKRVKGPSEEERKGSRSHVWGEVRSDSGYLLQARLTTANGYEMTVHGSLGVVERLLEKRLQPGYYTPSQLMGKDFVTTLPGSSEIRLMEKSDREKGEN